MLQVCSSYSQAVIVFKNLDDDTIIKSAKFRQNGRFPVLSYFHKDNGVSTVYIQLFLGNNLSTVFIQIYKYNGEYSFYSTML